MQQVRHEGEWFDYWRVRIAASVGAVPLDMLAASEQTAGRGNR